jgi:hypothetical protein
MGDAETPTVRQIKRKEQSFVRMMPMSRLREILNGESLFGYDCLISRISLIRVRGIMRSSELIGKRLLIGFYPAPLLDTKLNKDSGF